MRAYCWFILIFFQFGSCEIEQDQESNITLKHVKISFDGLNWQPDQDQSRLLEQKSFGDYCVQGRHGLLELGACSPVFLECRPDSEAQFRLCANEQVFVRGECKAARDVPACFDRALNSLNWATDKLAVATRFCERNSLGPSVFVARKSSCSRQGLICAPTEAGSVIPIGCPRGFALEKTTLKCKRAMQQCNFEPEHKKTTIQAALTEMYCHEHKRDHHHRGDGSGVGISRLDPLSLDKSWKHCRDWYVTCNAREPELVFCGEKHRFDKSKGGCRPAEEQDQCPSDFSCRGFEWRQISFGECRPDFVYCRGLQPVIYQCRPGFIFQHGECVKLDQTRCPQDDGGNGEHHHHCRVGEIKPNHHDCKKFFKCDHQSGQLAWSEYLCTRGSFDSELGECVEGRSCDSETCTDGESFFISCHRYQICLNGRFVHKTCPPRTGWDPSRKQCVYKRECDDQKPPSNQHPCIDGTSTVTEDCHKYLKCINGKYEKVPCRDGSNHLAKACDFCAPNSEQRYGVQDTFTDQMKEHNYREAECPEGEQQYSPADCSRFWRCKNGFWKVIQCPHGRFFKPKEFTCSLEHNQCEAEDNSVYAYQNENKKEYQEPVYEEPNKPIYYKDDKEDEETDQENENAYPTHRFCDRSHEGKKIAFPYDCQFYLECDIRRHQFVKRECPHGHHFSIVHKECRIGSCEEDNSECTEGVRKPLPVCGQFMNCAQGRWRKAACKDGKALIDGHCSKHVKCPEDNVPVNDECTPGRAKPHPDSCNKYFICEYGQLAEQICSNGAFFNPDKNRCDLNYECERENQPRCFEKQKKAVPGKCHNYKLCVDGEFQTFKCSGDKVYDADEERCKRGECHGDSGEEGGHDHGDSHDDGYDHGHHHDHSHSHEHGHNGPKPGEPCRLDGGLAGYASDPKNCRHFYQCAPSGWVRKDCPAGTGFNKNIAVCDFPHNIHGCVFP